MCVCLMRLCFSILQEWKIDSISIFHPQLLKKEEEGEYTIIYFIEKDWFVWSIAYNQVKAFLSANTTILYNAKPKY